MERIIHPRIAGEGLPNGGSSFQKNPCGKIDPLRMLCYNATDPDNELGGGEE